MMMTDHNDNDDDDDEDYYYDDNGNDDDSDPHLTHRNGMNSQQKEYTNSERSISLIYQSVVNKESKINKQQRHKHNIETNSNHSND